MCSKHFIKENELNEIMLDTINKYINLICNIEEKVNEVIKMNKISYEKEICKIKEVELEKNKKKYNKLLDELVEDYRNDYISKEDFDEFNRKYLYELNKQENELIELNNNHENFEIDWLKKVGKRKKY